MKTLVSPTRKGPARNSTARALASLAVGLMVAVAAFGPGASPSLAGNGHGNGHDNGPAAVGGSYADATSGGSVASISVPSCFGPEGMGGTLVVTVTSAPFVFDIWVTDHVPGGGDWTEIPGSRQTLTAQVSSIAGPFGPLSVAAHRDGVNSYRVETSGGNAKSASIHGCETTTPPDETTTPPDETTTPPDETTTPPATTKDPAPATAPETEIATVGHEPSVADPIRVQVVASSPAPTGAVAGVVRAAVTNGPSITLPPTDTVSSESGVPSSVPTWRLILLGLAALIASRLLFSDRAVRRRS